MTNKSFSFQVTWSQKKSDLFYNLELTVKCFVILYFNAGCAWKIRGQVEATLLLKNIGLPMLVLRNEWESQEKWFESFTDLLQRFGEGVKEFLYLRIISVMYLNCSFGIKEWKFFLRKRAVRVFLPQVEVCDNLMKDLFWRNTQQIFCKPKEVWAAHPKGCKLSTLMCIDSLVTYPFLTHFSLNT